MAKDCSFDVVSEFDKQELVNAVDQVKREISSRFDLKNSNSEVTLDADKSITITTDDEMKLRNIYDILQSKLVKRNLSIKILDPQGIESALGGNVRQVYNLKKGLTQELAKKITADIKDMKKKVQKGKQTFVQLNHPPQIIIPPYQKEFFRVFREDQQDYRMFTPF